MTGGVEEVQESFRFPACLLAAIFHVLGQTERGFTLLSAHRTSRKVALRVWEGQPGLGSAVPSNQTSLREKRKCTGDKMAVLLDLLFLSTAGIFAPSGGQRSPRQSGVQPVVLGARTPTRG